MSEYNPNIIFNKSCLDSDLHKSNLNIISLNLTELNNRLEKSIKIIYLDYDFKTKPFNDLDSDNIFVSNSINNFINWSNFNDEDKRLQVDLYLKHIENLHYDDVTQTVRPKSKINNRNRKSIFERFFAKKERFVKRFKGFYPIGFLETNQEELISDRLSHLCIELDDWVK